MQSYERYPVSLATGIAQIGGIFAFLRILLFFLHEFNRNYFEKDAKSQMGKGEEIKIKERYSIEEIDRLRDRIAQIESELEKIKLN